MFQELTKLLLFPGPLPLPFLKPEFLPADPQVLICLVPSHHSGLRLLVTKKPPLIAKSHLVFPSDPNAITL